MVFQRTDYEFHVDGYGFGGFWYCVGCKRHEHEEIKLLNVQRHRCRWSWCEALIECELKKTEK